MNKFALTLLMVISHMSCAEGSFTTENPDDFCKELLATGNPKELKSWLYDNKSTLGELQSNEESIKLANSAYEAGALNIFGIELEEDPEYGKNTGDLVVELPATNEMRKAVIEWAAPIAWEQGFEAYGDVGQQYIYVKLD